jgi:hypothetical protein
LVNIPQLVAGGEEILTALFERTYASLTPCAQRAFMTLAAWRSSIPRLALEAVLIRSILERQEVENGIESLLQFSMAETHVSPSDKQNFISLPLVASAFGKRKFNISPFKAAIQSDVEILQMLGPSRPDDIHLGLAKRLEKFISNITKRVESGESYESYSPILEMMCRAYNPGWLLMARWHMETGKSIDLAKAKEELNRYLENDPVGSSAAEAWFMLGKVCRLTNDTLGEIHAFIERSQINSVPFYDISSTANLLNRSLHTLDLVRRQLSCPPGVRIASHNNQTTGEPLYLIRLGFNSSCTSHF